MAGGSPAEIWRERPNWEQARGATTVGSLDPNWDIEQKQKLGRLMYSLIIGAGAGAAASGAGGAAGGAPAAGEGGGGMFSQYLKKMGTGGPFGHGEAGPSFGSGFGNAMWQMRGGGGGYGDTKAPPAVGPQTGPAASAVAPEQSPYPPVGNLGPQDQMAAPPAVGPTDFGADPMAMSPGSMAQVQRGYNEQDPFLQQVGNLDPMAMSPGPQGPALPPGAPSLQDPMAMSPGAMEQLQRGFGPPSDDQERIKHALFLISLLKGR